MESCLIAPTIPGFPLPLLLCWGSCFFMIKGSEWFLILYLSGEKKNLAIWAAVDSVLPTWTWSSLVMFPAFISSDYVSYTPVIMDQKLISSWFYLDKKWGLWDCWVLPRAGHLHQGMMVIVLLTGPGQHRTLSGSDWLQHESDCNVLHGSQQEKDSAEYASLWKSRWGPKRSRMFVNLAIIYMKIYKGIYPFNG